MKAYRIIGIFLIMLSLTDVRMISGIKREKSIRNGTLVLAAAGPNKEKKQEMQLADQKANQQIVPQVIESTPTTKDISQEQPKKILLGTTMDLSRMNKDMSGNIRLGIDLALSERTLKNIEIQFNVFDDMYMPEKARENVLKLINEDGCQFLIGIPFAEGFYRYLDLIKEGKIAVLFPISGDPFKRTQEVAMKYCIYYRPSFYDEASALARHFMEAKPTKVIAFYPDDIVGQASLEAVTSVIGSKVQIVKAPYRRNDTNFENQIKIIEKESPDFVILGALPTAAIELIRQMDRTLLSKIKFYGGSTLFSKVFQDFAKEKNLDIKITSLVPDPVNSNLPIVVKFRALAQEKNIALSPLTLEGYLTTSFLLDVFNHIEGPITKESVIAALENIKNVDFQGIKLNFDPVKRQLSNTVWIAEEGVPWRKIIV